MEIVFERDRIVPNKKVWIDLDNSPHVPFFHPIIDELKKCGIAVMLTARDAFQVAELVRLHGLHCKCVGHHYGKHELWKLVGLAVRTVQLLPTVVREHPILAVSHGSRTQLLVCKLLHIPTLCIADYEFTRLWVRAVRPTWVMSPEMIPADAFDYRKDRIFTYPGIKEDVYVPRFKPDPRLKTKLHLDGNDVIVTIRPPATEAHYHTARSDELFRAAMERLGREPSLKLVMLPRNEQQAVWIRQQWPELFASQKVTIPPHAVDGLNLIWHSDLVISGGGTMSREAAALGVPVYSIFGGIVGAVDKCLSDAGRLVLLATADDVRTKIRLVRRHPPLAPQTGQRTALRVVVETIIWLLDRHVAGDTSSSRAWANAVDADDSLGE